MNKGYSRKIVLAAAMATTWTATTPSAIAQEEGLALEEVIVTARKREESMQDVPVSVSALGDQL